MLLAFYKGPGDLITRLIRVITRGPYSHVTLIFSNGMTFEASGHGEHPGISLGFKTYNSTDWTFFEFLRISSDDEEKLKEYCWLFVGRKFGWFGLVTFLLPFLKDVNHLYCSQLLVLVFQHVLGIFNELPLHISPNHLYDYCESVAVDRSIHSNTKRILRRINTWQPLLTSVRIMEHQQDLQPTERQEADLEQTHTLRQT